MKENERRAAAKAFAEYWKDKGYEKGESQPFWLELLENVFGVKNPAHYIKFEEQVSIDKTNGFIDAMIPETKVMIEQKGINKDLRKGILQSDGSMLTPFQQAKRYIVDLPPSIQPRYIITCNFKEFLIYDRERPNDEPESIKLCDLEKEYYRLMFLVDKEDENIKREMEISIQAGNVVGALYDEILKQYVNPENEETLKSLNQLCVRLVFCLYAEDAGIFGGHNKFHNYIQAFDAKDIRQSLINLFEILDTKIEERSPYIDERLKDFPYVNGGLFADSNIEIPQFNEKIKDMLLTKASADFDWSDISPTIFGAVFESTLNPETRRSGGMHYTSIENIHKVIDPLFLDELKEELEEIKETKVGKIRENKLNAYIDKLSQINFLDPACGSGNFLTETYISLRRLENEALKLIHGDSIVMAVKSPIRVSIGQFYGIEINDFAVTVAKTALWIAESQMLKETEDILHLNIDFLPLKSYANIIEGNALRMDWNDVIPKEKLNYIMGNPPFVGIRHSKENHREDLKKIISAIPKSGSLDYVTAWYIKACDIMKENTNIKTGFVSTNSIMQGEQAYNLWHYILEKNQFKINFAHKTFKWNSETKEKAAVHCVIIGFSKFISNKCMLFTDSQMMLCENINQYLLPTENVWIKKQKKPLQNIPEMLKGCYPTDNGNYIFTRDEMEKFIKKEPLSKKYFRRWIGSEDMLNNGERYILFLKECAPTELKKMRLVLERVENVKVFREKSTKEGTRKKALTPTLLDEERIPKCDFLVIPVVSSENRRYIPLIYKQPPDICYASTFFIENANLYLFGVLMSNTHMAWTRVVCGRLKSDYRYSNTLVYNNFPWCNPTDEQKAKIEKTAQGILDARALYPDCSLADLYDDIAMPPELRKAHQLNDKAVWEAYGKKWDISSESECVAYLMKMYQELTEQ